MDDFRAKPSLADDPGFISSLEALDSGLSDHIVPPETPHAPLLPAQRLQLPELPGVFDDGLPPPAGRPPRRLNPHPFPPSIPQTAPAPVAAPSPAVAKPGDRPPLLDLLPARPPTAPPPSPTVARNPDAAAAVETGRALADVFGIPERRPLAHETFYGLSGPAFSETLDPKFFYPAASHEPALDRLVEGLQQRDGVLLVVADEGLGKTLLCRAALAQLDGRALTSFIDDQPVSPEALLQRLLVDFGVISRGDVEQGRLLHATRADLMSALHGFFTTLAPLNATAVAVVDDVDRLGNAVLQQIRALGESGGSGAVLQLVLTGAPRVLARLADPDVQLETLVRRTVLIEPLESGDVLGYVSHRLIAAGSGGRLDVDERASARLFDLSGGSPRVINQLCERALALGAADAASVIDGPLVERAAADAGIVAAHSAVPRLAQLAVTILAVISLLLLGAGGAALLLDDRIGALVIEWEAIPPLPAARPVFQAAPPTLPANVDPLASPDADLHGVGGRAVVR